MAETLRRSEILRRRVDLNRVLRNGRRVFGPALSLRFCRQPEPSPAGTPSRRIAFLLSRMVRGGVERNRLKRRLREIYRRHKYLFPDACDFTVHAGPDACELSFGDLLAQTLRLAARAAELG